MQEFVRTNTGLRRRLAAAALLCLAAAAQEARAAETDQYMTWNVILSDSGDALNGFIQECIDEFLERANARVVPYADCDELVIGLYSHIYAGLHSSRIRGFFQESPEVALYPDRSVSNFEYQRRSILRGLAFPYILPMGRTIRVGDIYFGTDKFGHFFGFGRRYLQRYLRHRAEGDSHEEAAYRIVRWGIHMETGFVGLLVDGVFSHGDLEANYQGFLMAMNFCRGDLPYFGQVDGEWRLMRPVDFRDYVTPDFDESFNPSHYWALRRRQVLPILQEEYCDKQDGEIVTERFARYRKDYRPSFSKDVIDAHFEERGRDPQYLQSLDHLCSEDAEEEERPRLPFPLDRILGRN